MCSTVVLFREMIVWTVVVGNGLKLSLLCSCVIMVMNLGVALSRALLRLNSIVLQLDGWTILAVLCR